MSGYLTTTIYGSGWTGSVIPGGMQLGDEMVVTSANSPYGGTNLFRLVRNNPSGGTITANEALKMTAGQDVVDATAAAGDIIVGVNDISGSAGTGISVTVGQYFWMNKKGMCKPLVAASQSAGASLVSTATGGTLSTWTAQDTVPANTNLILLAASGGSGGPTLAYQY